MRGASIISLSIVTLRLVRSTVPPLTFSAATSSAAPLSAGPRTLMPLPAMEASRKAICTPVSVVAISSVPSTSLLPSSVPLRTFAR